MLNSQNINANQVQGGLQPQVSAQPPQVQPKVRLDVNQSPALDMAGFEKLPLTQALLQKGLVTKQQALGIKNQIENTGKLESDVILSGLFIDQDKLLQIKSIVYKIPYIDLANTPVPVETLQKLRSDVAQRYQAIVFDDQPDHMKIAMVDPLDIQATNFISTMIGKRVDAYFADPASITKIIQTKYGAQVGSEVSKALEDVKTEVVDVSGNIDEVKTLQGDISSAPVARIVNVILEYAVRMKASDIHIEPRENKLIVRNRIHGVLSEKLVLPSKLAPSVVSRVKILANLKIDEHRVPQDGRFQIKVDKDFIDLRVSIIPTAHGEKIVMRLLEKAGGAITLDQTGLRGRNYDEFYKAIRKTMGIVLVTGPTGSGKTVTLASCLKILNTEGVNILTLEDPVEIRIDGVNQVQVNPEVGLTFAKGLRAFLRQDPNIIMIGEIRDGETAELAVQAALTGHLVLATLHTNSAATAMPRLIDMGVEPFLLASTINIAAAQRLVRKVCDNCKKPYNATPEEIKKISDILSSIKGFNLQNLIAKNNGNLILYKGQGCDACSNTGYKGRIGIFEVLPITENIRSMIISHEAAQTIEKAGLDEGMTTMQQDGFLKVLEGITTIEEILRVVS
jgi:type IV pilus assembly protein PilB